VVLEEKFSFLAFLFPFVYAIKNGMKLFSLYLLIVQAIILSISQSFSEFSNILSVFFSIVSGAFAADLYILHLKKNGYKLKDIIYAESELDAEIMFYGRMPKFSGVAID